VKENVISRQRVRMRMKGSHNQQGDIDDCHLSSFLIVCVGLLLKDRSGGILHFRSSTGLKVGGNADISSVRISVSSSVLIPPRKC